MDDENKHPIKCQLSLQGFDKTIIKCMVLSLSTIQIKYNFLKT